MTSAWMGKEPEKEAVSSVQTLSRVRLSATPWTAARQASLSINSITVKENNE